MISDLTLDDIFENASILWSKNVLDEKLLKDDKINSLFNNFVKTLNKESFMQSIGINNQSDSLLNYSAIAYIQKSTLEFYNQFLNSITPNDINNEDKQEESKIINDSNKKSNNTKLQESILTKPLNSIQTKNKAQENNKTNLLNETYFEYKDDKVTILPNGELLIKEIILNSIKKRKNKQNTDVTKEQYNDIVNEYKLEYNKRDKLSTEIDQLRNNKYNIKEINSNTTKNNTELIKLRLLFVLFFLLIILILKKNIK